MGNLKPVTRVTVGEQVAVQVAELISDGCWRPGEKLPSEADLCRCFSIGRSILRGPLKSFAFVGLVRTRPGDGTYVAERSPGLLDRILARGLLKTEKELADVCETRLVLETELASMAAERAEPEDFALLKELLAGSRESLAGRARPFIEVDLEFHLAIARCAKNDVLRRLLSDIRGVLIEWIAKSQELPGLRENALEQHEVICARIFERNSAVARAAMEGHLSTFQRAYTLLGRIENRHQTTAV